MMMVGTAVGMVGEEADLEEGAMVGAVEGLEEGEGGVGLGRDGRGRCASLSGCLAKVSGV